jgi:hypothetical protein
MTRPAISILLTLNSRSLRTLERVYASLEALEADAHQIHIVLDSPDAATRDAHRRLRSPNWSEQTIMRDPGWICPAAAWNSGFARISTEFTFCLSSDTVQAPENLARALDILQVAPCVVFGTTTNEPLTDLSAVGGLDASMTDLCSSQRPRPLGFIVAMPTWAIRLTGGYDLDFMRGLWYEDNDFTWRLWRLGLPFVFDDSISGIHIDHARPPLTDSPWREKIAANRDLMLSKWQRVDPWATVARLEFRQPGRTVWIPEVTPDIFAAQQRLITLATPVVTSA